MKFPIHFANSDDASAVALFPNELTLAQDGWAQLAPFGDYAGSALLRQADGTYKKFPATQRLDRAAAESMVQRFKTPWQRLKRYFTGCPIYAGHPDVPAFANDYADKSSKGMIVDLAVRDDGLYCKPVFTDEGSDLVESKRYRAFSAYWSADAAGEENGQPVYRPSALKSAGLTNNPNLPVHLLNERPAETPPLDADLQATCGQLNSLVAQLQTELANERQFHAGVLLADALRHGTITAVERPAWAQRLAADFTNESIALAQLPRRLKTAPLNLNSGVRKADIANVSDRQTLLAALLRVELNTNGGDYDRAFAQVQKTNPALFQAMKQPHTA